MPYEGLCKVYMAGPANANDPNLPYVMSINLVEPESSGFPGSEMWVVAPPGREREFLAVAMAAITSKKKVLAGIRDPVVSWCQINGLYLTDQSTE